MTSGRQAVSTTAEGWRLIQDARREANWKRWGPYLSEREWGTVREDYSVNGACWDYFPHDHARSRTYRWGEDGLLGISDRQGRLCFALALWNEHDAILKERLFGLNGTEGNHGEDVKELYYYLDATPTSTYLKARYKYPHETYPYDKLLAESRRRTRRDPEYEVLDTGVFDDGRYFDVTVEYAKASAEDILIVVTVANRGPVDAAIHLLPTLWFRNTWSWGKTEEGYGAKPELARDGLFCIRGYHDAFGDVRLFFEDTETPELLFTENETNAERLFDFASATPYKKDGFHEHVVWNVPNAVNPLERGTKAAGHYRRVVPAHGSTTVRMRLVLGPVTADEPFGKGFENTIALRKYEADEFYDALLPAGAMPDERNVLRQAYAGLIWSRQFYHYVVRDWLDGDPKEPAPPPVRKRGRNREWRHVFSRDVLSMPDKWEYPWFAAWDLAFHMIPTARLDPEFAKGQLLLLLREWYMHPNGQLPAYEFAFGDVNPPVHAWAAWRVYKMTGSRGHRDIAFLEKVFQKLLFNFTWWVNRKDSEGNNLFSGGFLGLDNIGLFDRSKPLPAGGYLEQADGTAWMAFFAGTMLSMALELANHDPVYEDLASKFFEHFIAIVDAMNTLGGTGLWDDVDGFYYDRLNLEGQTTRVRTRSMVGVIPLFIVEVIDDERIARLPGFKKRMDWFLEHRPDLARHISYRPASPGKVARRLFAVPSRDRLVRVLRYVLDEAEFLSPHGVRSLSRFHLEHPFVMKLEGSERSVAYAPGESDSDLFGGNSNWRGPVWFPVNYLLVEALERYHHFYGDSLTVEYPTGSGTFLNLYEVAGKLARRLTQLFMKREDGSRACHGADRRYADDPQFDDLVLFYEYFHGDDGRGLGASHQTGWTALVIDFLETACQRRSNGETV
ncbi:MAG TPA: glucosidase [Polyangiaceae bacterium]|jgi:hypothetical protein|nr:glucosidase [Polyangiaceae bacterium]